MGKLTSSDRHGKGTVSVEKLNTRKNTLYVKIGWMQLLDVWNKKLERFLEWN